MSLKDEAQTVGDVERHLQDSMSATKSEAAKTFQIVTNLANQNRRFIALIREFVEADAEMERHMANTSIEDALKRPPVFDRYDAAVAALKEAVK